MIDKTNLNDLIDRVLESTVPIPTKPYYVNYDLRTYNYTSSTCVISKYWIGPYPKTVALLLVNNWVETFNVPYTASRGWYTSIISNTISMKPKKGATMAEGPSQGEIENILLHTLVAPLEVYRDLHRNPLP